MKALYKRSHGNHQDILDNVKMIREHLQPNCLIEFKCYNKQEVDETKDLLSEEERKQVRFFWFNFGT